MKPTVFIAMASKILGGPGKGLVQFFNNGGLDACAPVCIRYAGPGHEETEFLRALEGTGVQVHSLRQRRALDPGLITQALDLVRREKCDVLQSHGYKSHVICAVLRGLTGLPWIAFVHGWTAENMRVRCYHALEKALVPFATRVVAVSESIARHLSFVPRGKLLVIPNAVDPDEARKSVSGRDVRGELGIPAGALVAGVVGRLSPEKGQTYFLRALAGARRSLPGLVGLLVGDGQDRTALMREVERLGLTGAVFFAGHVSGLGDFYRAMDIVVMPSLSEGMPNVALEAMLFGRALVATRVGGVTEVVEDGVTGLIVEPQNVESLAGGILTVLSHGELPMQYGEAGRLRVLDRFNPMLRTRRIAGVYADVLGVRPHVT